MDQYQLDENKIREKIENGTWTQQEAGEAILKLGRMDSLKDASSMLLVVCYGIFSYAYRELLTPGIELCQKGLMQISKEEDLIRVYLALMRLYSTLGFQPKIIEYGKKYSASVLAERGTLKSVYNTMSVAFSDIGLYEEASIYMKKMLEITKDRRVDDREDEETIALNQAIFDDTMVYIQIELGNKEEAKRYYHLLEEGVRTYGGSLQKMMEKEVEFTEMYMELHVQGESRRLAERFCAGMEEWMNTVRVKNDISYCAEYYACFLEMLEHLGMRDQAIRYGSYIVSAREFIGNCQDIYRFLICISEKSNDQTLQEHLSVWKNQYIQILELEHFGHKKLMKILTVEEVRIMEMEESMETDLLTSCKNRYFLEQKGQIYLEQFKSGTLTFMDLDHLKRVNDSWGHSSGDDYLRYFAEGMKRSMKDREILFRYAGDEFILLSREKRDELKQRMEKLQESPDLLFKEKGIAEPIEFSYGISEFPQDAKEMDKLIHIADKRMYLCKKRHHERNKQEMNAE